MLDSCLKLPLQHHCLLWRYSALPRSKAICAFCALVPLRPTRHSRLHPLLSRRSHRFTHQRKIKRNKFSKTRNVWTPCCKRTIVRATILGRWEFGTSPQPNITLLVELHRTLPESNHLDTIIRLPNPVLRSSKAICLAPQRRPSRAPH